MDGNAMFQYERFFIHVWELNLESVQTSNTKSCSLKENIVKKLKKKEIGKSGQYIKKF